MLEHVVLKLGTRRCCRPLVIFLKAKRKILIDLGNSATTYLRESFKGKKLTAKDVRDGKMLSSIIGDGLAYRVLPAIRTSPMYLRKRKNHAIAMIRQFGSPQLFVTLSFEENYAPELLKQMHKNFTGDDITLLEALNMKIADKTKYVRNEKKRSSIKRFDA